MMAAESGKDKVKKICDILRRETLEPAKQEAEAIVHSAHEKAGEIVSSARKEAEAILKAADEEILRQKNIFQSSLGQACSQALEVLREQIEEKLLHRNLMQLITKQTQDPKVLAELIEAVVKGIEKEGVDANLSVLIPASVPARAVNVLLAQEVLSHLKEKSVILGRMSGGIEVKLVGENITIDITDAALKELVANYIRKDFRELLFVTG
ncbi:MAG: V-type ATP synthase subunit E [Verrucomicrobia bacterium]|nr:V-type ATP synthase subunit E [Verrucomicrobiota bacterium]